MFPSCSVTKVRYQNYKWKHGRIKTVKKQFHSFIAPQWEMKSTSCKICFFFFYHSLISGIEHFKIHIMFNWIKIIKLYSILSDDISKLVLIYTSSFFLVKEDQQEKSTDLTALHTLRSTQCKKTNKTKKQKRKPGSNLKQCRQSFGFKPPTLCTQPLAIFNTVCRQKMCRTKEKKSLWYSSIVVVSHSAWR